MTYSRYAIYYAPPETAGWTRFCTGWLGWDMLSGRPAGTAPPNPSYGVLASVLGAKRPGPGRNPVEFQ